MSDTKDLKDEADTRNETATENKKEHKRTLDILDLKEHSAPKRVKESIPSVQDISPSQRLIDEINRRLRTHGGQVDQIMNLSYWLNRHKLNIGVNKIVEYRHERWPGSFVPRRTTHETKCVELDPKGASHSKVQICAGQSALSDEQKKIIQRWFEAKHPLDHSRQ